ncbi:MAG: hypothetical protein KIT68_01345 [Phycisphaeraceae bacterium]|nr:hypothetical protein [Phycisphaeraceae bacterium]
MPPTRRSFFHSWRPVCAAASVLAAAAMAGCASERAAAPAGTASVSAVGGDRQAAEREKDLASFDQVWTTVRDQHYDPALNGVDWEAARAELRPKVEAAGDREQARSAMRELLARLGQSHFSILPAEAYEAPAERRAEHAGNSGAGPDGGGLAVGGGGAGRWAAGNPVARSGEGETGVRIRMIDGQPVVAAVDPTSLAARAGVRPGWRLVRIGDRDVATLVERLARAVPDARTLPMMQAMALESRLATDAGAGVRATFEDGTGRLLEVVVPSGSPRGNVSKMMNLPDTHVRLEDRWLEGHVGYISLNIFLDPPRVMDAFGKAVERYRDGGARGLVIDLRGNPGGVGAMAMGMGGWFVDRPNLRLGEMITRAGRLKFVLNPRLEPYMGPLAVLVDECSASTSEILAGGLKDIGRARVFGVATPGMALPSMIVPLPNGDRFQYAFANYISAGGKPLEASGVTPDEPSGLTRAALLAGHDPVLNAALAWIASAPGTSQPGLDTGAKPEAKP